MSEVLTGTISGTVKISGDLIPRGIDGYSPTIDVEPIDGGTKIIINDISGTKTATINDGATGAQGVSGKDGVSVTHSWNGTTLNITSASGTTSANLKGETGAAGSNGKDGTSITVKSVSESSADGGSNVVTFSDGKTLTVKNGKTGTGAAGKDGKSAYQYAVDGGYAGTEAEFSAKLAEEAPKPLTVMVDFDGSEAEANGTEIQATYDVPYYQILAEYQKGATIVCAFLDSATNDEIVVPLIAYNNDTWFYTTGIGAKYRYFIRITPDGAFATCETYSTGGSGGGVTSWNGLEDKPEGVGYTYPTNPVFDGNLEGREAFDMGNNIWFVKMSDYVPTEEECIGATITRYMGGTTIDVTVQEQNVADASEIMGIPGFVVVDVSDGVVPLIGVVKTDSTYMGVDVPAGTYYVYYNFQDFNVWYVKNFNVLEGKEEVHKIPSKYLDLSDGIGHKEFTDLVPETRLSYNDDVDGYVIPSFVPEVGKEYEVTYNGSTYTSTAFEAIVSGYGPSICVGNTAGAGGENTGEPFIIGYVKAFAMTGCIPLDGSTDITVRIRGEKIYKINAMYLPDADPLETIDLFAAGFPEVVYNTSMSVDDIDFEGVILAILKQLKNHGYAKISFACCKKTSGEIRNDRDRYETQATVFSSRYELNGTLESVYAQGIIIRDLAVYLVSLEILYSPVLFNDLRIFVYPMYKANSQDKLCSRPVLVSDIGKIFSLKVADDGTISAQEETYFD